MILSNSRRRKCIYLLACVFAAAIIFLPVPVRSAAEDCAEPLASGKTGNTSMLYCAVALLSIMLLIGGSLMKQTFDRRFMGLFACIAAANCGYFLQAVSASLPWAMMANRLSYLGSAYAILAMLLIIMDTCQVQRSPAVTAVLFGVTTAAFLLAASGDWLGLYYKAVALERSCGMSRLVKVYGPLHILYPVYLLSCFALMGWSIWDAARRNALSSPKYTAFLAAAAMLNLIVWGVEQVSDVQFEFLSVSYLTTGILLLVIVSLLRDYGIIRPDGEVVSVQMLTRLNTRYADGELPPDMEKLFDAFARRVGTLSPAERRILNYYIDGYEIADVPELAFISIHTVKKHNRSIYQKLDVASRDDLMLYIEMFRCCGRLEELTAAAVSTDQ